MAYNVISCRKVAENTQNLKIAKYENLAPTSEITKNSQKTDHPIAIFSIFFNGCAIFFMRRGESSCPYGSEYVWQRGVGGL